MEVQANKANKEKKGKKITNDEKFKNLFGKMHECIFLYGVHCRVHYTFVGTSYTTYTGRLWLIGCAGSSLLAGDKLLPASAALPPASAAKLSPAVGAAAAAALEGLEPGREAESPTEEAGSRVRAGVRPAIMDYNKNV